MIQTVCVLDLHMLIGTNINDKCICAVLTIGRLAACQEVIVIRLVLRK